MAIHAGRRGWAGGVDGKVGSQAFLKIPQAAVGHQTTYTPDFQSFHQDIADRRNVGPTASVDNQYMVSGHILDGNAGRIVFAAQDLGRRQILAHGHVAEREGIANDGLRWRVHGFRPSHGNASDTALQELHAHGGVGDGFEVRARLSIHELILLYCHLLITRRKYSTQSMDANQIDRLFDEVVGIYDSGDLMEAERRCHNLCNVYPTYAPAVGLMGVILCQTGRGEIGVQFIEKATELAPDEATFFNNLGTGYTGLKRLEEALSAFDRAIELAPNNAQAHNNIGSVLRPLGWLN